MALNGFRAFEEEPADLYPDHMDALQVQAEQALEQSGFDSLVIDAGVVQHHHRDDTAYLFKPSLDFAKWSAGLNARNDSEMTVNGARLDLTPGHVIYFKPGRKPKLLINDDPDIFWETPTAIPEGVRNVFNVQIYKTRDDIIKSLRRSRLGKAAYLGPAPAEFEGSFEAAPWQLAYSLDSQGLTKTDFELACIFAANHTAAEGHKEALETFLSGRTEAEIMHAFQVAAGQSAFRAPYSPIFGIGANGATLHYDKAHFSSARGDSLLIDAGTTHLWYPSDISTTYVNSKVHQAFLDLVAGVDQVHDELVEMMNPETDFDTIQREMYIKLAQVLLDVGILRGVSAQEAAERGYAKAFCPHSVGHSLGIRTHDLGGLLLDEHGNRFMTDSEDPILKDATFARPDFGENQVWTVEPGIYFMESQLAPFRSKADDSQHFNWDLIDQLEGGIRIETNVLVNSHFAKGHFDITRQFLPKGTNVHDLSGATGF